MSNSHLIAARALCASAQSLCSPVGGSKVVLSHIGSNEECVHVNRAVDLVRELFCHHAGALLLREAVLQQHRVHHGGGGTLLRCAAEWIDMCQYLQASIPAQVIRSEFHLLLDECREQLSLISLDICQLSSAVDDIAPLKLSDLLVLTGCEADLSDCVASIMHHRLKLSFPAHVALEPTQWLQYLFAGAVLPASPIHFVESIGVPTNLPHSDHHLIQTVFGVSLGVARFDVANLLHCINAGEFQGKLCVLAGDLTASENQDCVCRLLSSRSVRLLLVEGLVHCSWHQHLLAHNIVFLSRLSWRELDSVIRFANVIPLHYLPYLTELDDVSISTVLSIRPVLAGASKSLHVAHDRRIEPEDTYLLLCKVHDDETAIEFNSSRPVTVFLSHSSTQMNRLVRDRIDRAVSRFTALGRDQRCVLGGGVTELLLYNHFSAPGRTSTADAAARQTIRSAFADSFKRQLIRLLTNCGLSQQESVSRIDSSCRSLQHYQHISQVASALLSGQTLLPVQLSSSPCLPLDSLSTKRAALDTAGDCILTLFDIGQTLTLHSSSTRVTLAGAARGAVQSLFL